MRLFRLLPVLVGVVLLGLCGHPLAAPLPPGGTEEAKGKEPLPARALARLGSERLRHSSQVRSLAFSRDGRILVSAAIDGPPRSWDAHSGKPVRSLAGPCTSVLRMAFSPDGKLVAVTCVDRSKPVRMWDATTGKVHPWRANHTRSVGPPLAFSPDGKTLATVEQVGVIYLWDVGTAKEVRRFSAPWKGRRTVPVVLAVAFSPDGKELLACSQDGAVCLWKVASGELLYRVQVGKAVSAVAFSPDGWTFALAGGLGLSLRKAATGEELRRLEGHRGYVLAVAFAPDGKTLVSGGNDRTVRLWDVVSGRERRCILGHSNLVEAVAFAPDGKTVASGGRDQRVRLWDVGTGRELYPAQGHRSVLWALSFSSDGKLLASAGADGMVCLWDVTGHKLVRRLEGEAGQSGLLAFSPDGRTLASTAVSPDRNILLWDLASGKVSQQFQANSRAGFASLGFSADGKKLVIGGHDQNVRLYLTTGKELRQWPCNGFIPHHVLISADGNTVTAASFAHVIASWSVVSGAEQSRVQGKGSFRLGCAVSLDGRNLAGQDANHVFVWEMATGKERIRIPHKEWTWALAFSPDGKRLIGALDRAIAVWDLPTGQEVGRFSGLSCTARVLVCSPDGKTLASGGSDGTVLLWGMDRLPKPKRPAPRELSVTELEAEWQALRRDDAARAYRACVLLQTAPRQVLPLLRRDLRPKAPADPKRIAQLLKDLDSEDAAARDKATTELERLGDQAEATLLKALAANPSADMKLRLRRLLNRAGRVTEERLRTVRMLELLEDLGTPEARQLLKTLADNKSDGWLAAEARAAGDRLRRRGGR